MSRNDRCWRRFQQEIVVPEWIGRCSARGTPLSGSSLSGAAQELGWVGVTPFLTLAFLARPP